MEIPQLQEPNLRSILMGSTTNKYSTISIKKFRNEVEAIEDDKARTVIEAYYILAARLCELSAVTNPCEMKIGASRPYGLFNTFSLENFEVTPADTPILPRGMNAITGKALVITVAWHAFTMIESLNKYFRNRVIQFRIIQKDKIRKWLKS